MAFKLRWSPEAIGDIEEIASYIAKDSEFYAKSVVTECLKIANNIIENPHIGRVVPEIDKQSIRERFLYSYRMIYQVEEESVLILAVIHGKRLVERVIDRLEDE